MKLPKKIVLTIGILLVSFLLRVFQLDNLPPSLYWEEVALGYDAYSILKTGKDHHNHSFPIVAFESYGDYKPTGYFYAIVPFILLFGLNAWAVRLPSAIAGTIIVLFVGKIAQELFSKEVKSEKKKETWYSLLISPDILAMIATTFSPWAIQFSRGGWEVNLATSFVTIGVYCGLLGIRTIQSKQPQRKTVLKYYVLSLMFFVLSAYTYHSTRFIGPCLGIVMGIPLLLQGKKFWKEVVLLGVVALLLMSPIVISSRDPSVTHRLDETSAFTTQNEINESNELIQHFGSSRVAKILFHRYWFYTRTFLTNALTHFRLDFLFLSGDSNTRHSIHFFGLFFPTDSILLLFGITTALYRWRKRYHVLWLWIFIGLVPAAITKAIPHALRTLPIMPAYMLLIGLGTHQLFEFLSSLPFSKLLKSVMIFIFAFEVVLFWHYYILVYPSESSKEWQYGYQQMIESVHTLSRPNEKIYITTEQKRPAMYYWFFTKTDPKLVQAEESTVAKDQGEFKSFGLIDFIFYLSGSEKGVIVSSPLQRKNFAVATDLAVINDLKGQPIWVIYRVE